MQKLYTHAHVYTRVNARSPSAGVPKLLFDAHAPRRIEVNEKNRGRRRTGVVAMERSAPVSCGRRLPAGHRRWRAVVEASGTYDFQVGGGLHD
jgi:hypothetical protein